MICCPKTATDDNGRAVVFSNIGYQSEMQTALAIPRDTWLDKGGILRQAFVPELRALRVNSAEISKSLQLSPAVANGSRIPGIVGIPGFIGHQMEMKARIYLNHTADEATDSTEIGLIVLGTSEWTSHVAIGVNVSGTIEASHVFIDRRSIGNNTLLHDIRAAPLGRVAPMENDQSMDRDGEGDETTALEFHVIVDHSIITAIVNNHTALTVEVYPESLASMRVGAYAVSHPRPSDGKEHASGEIDAGGGCGDACAVTMDLKGWFLSAGEGTQSQTQT